MKPRCLWTPSQTGTAYEYDDTELSGIPNLAKRNKATAGGFRGALFRSARVFPSESEGGWSPATVGARLPPSFGLSEQESRRTAQGGNVVGRSALDNSIRYRSKE